MEAIIKHYVRPNKTDWKWLTGVGVSLLVPLLILVLRPIGLTARQSAVAASVLLAIIWWSSGLVKKIPASIFLILAFALVSGTGLRTVLAFPLSETFPMIVITYLFSQAIANSGLIDKLFEPVLLRMVHTPCQCLAAMTALLFLTIYVIPQPLARLIIVATMFSQFLKRTTLPEKTKSVLMYTVFLMEAVVNMSSKDADMIMNHVAAGFSDVPISNGMWMHYMLVPTLICSVLVILLFILMFHRDMLGLKLEIRDQREKMPFSGQQKKALVIIAATILLWMTGSLHGLNNTVITVGATVLLFAIGILHREDFKAIDITTLIFLTAAFSIGGVMKESGAADKVFGLMAGIFPGGFSVRYLLVMVFVSMLIHMLLGSNTTTLSVVVPGMMILCGQLVSSPVIVFTAIVSVSFHAILPFHSVSVMIGASNGYFPSGFVTKMGIPVTFLVYGVVAGVFLPYWKIMGLL